MIKTIFSSTYLDIKKHISGQYSRPFVLTLVALLAALHCVIRELLEHYFGINYFSQLGCVDLYALSGVVLVILLMPVGLNFMLSEELMEMNNIFVHTNHTVASVFLGRLVSNTLFALFAYNAGFAITIGLSIFLHPFKILDSLTIYVLGGAAIMFVALLFTLISALGLGKKVKV